MILTGNKKFISDTLITMIFLRNTKTKKEDGLEKHQWKDDSSEQLKHEYILW